MRWVEDNCVGCPQGCANCGRGEYWVFACDTCGKSSTMYDEDGFQHYDNDIDICGDCFNKMCGDNAMQLVDANSIIDEFRDAGIRDLDKIINIMRLHGIDYDPYKVYIDIMSNKQIHKSMIPVKEVLDILEHEARWEE